MGSVSPGSNSSTGRCARFSLHERVSLLAKRGPCQCLHHTRALDMVTMLMGDYKSGDVVCREAKLRHAFKCLAAGQAVVDHDEPLRPSTSAQLPLSRCRGYEGAGET